MGKTFLVTTWRLTDALLMFADIKARKKNPNRRETILITSKRRRNSFEDDSVERSIRKK